jgi:hypothetical protein
MLALGVPPASKDAGTEERPSDNASRLTDQSNAFHTKDSQMDTDCYNQIAVPQTPRLSMSMFDMPDWFMSAFQQNGVERADFSGNTSRSMTGDTRELPLSFDNVSSLQNGKASPNNTRSWGYPPGTAYVRSIPKSVTKEHYELYLDYFHHRWPIIHVPSFEKGYDPYILSAAVDMIGSWLQGSCESKMVALTLHDRLTNHIFQRMVCTRSA